MTIIIVIIVVIPTGIVIFTMIIICVPTVIAIVIAFVIAIAMSGVVLNDDNISRVTDTTTVVCRLQSACGDGSIRAWSVHHHGGYLGAWIGVHHVGDMVTAMVPCPENNLLFTGDSSGYIKVWDISHYLIRCRSCSDEEHAERQDVWDRFPMMKWLRHLEEICMLHLDFRCMKTAHERDTPHLLNSFRGHVRVINSIDHFQNKHGSFLLTAGGDCSVRLWTLDGLFMGIFGQSRLWELSSVPTQVPPRRHRTDKYHRPRGYLLPPDVRKCGSSTTLHVMNAFTPNRWIRIVNLVRGVNAFKSILRRSSSERVAKEKQIQAILDIPVAEETKYKRMVVESIAPKARVRNDPPKPRIPYYRLQCPAYRTFPLQEITDIDFPGISTMLKGVRDRYGFSHRDQVHMRFARIARQMTKPSGSVLGRQDGEDGTGRKNTAMGRFAIIAKATVKKERSTDTNDGT
ncbi:hypothetical protein LSAT2_003488 [Lamellibrachia satsuma]|nr:hypothetical protein LSAT2_003488 [Lamellibrachia satsuma]